MILFILAITDSQTSYLMYTGRRESLMSGLYGGRVDPSNNGTESNLFELGYDSASYRRSFHDGLSILSESYDPISKEVLVSLDANFNSRLTLLKGPICAGMPRKLPDKVIDYARIVVPPENSYFFSPFTTGFKAIAYYNSKIYFVLNGVYGKYLNWIDAKSGTPFIIRV